MSLKQKVLAALASGLAIVGFVAATTLAFPQATSAQTPVAGSTAKTAAVGERGGPGVDGVMGERGGPRGDANGHETYLAQALGITEDALQTARTAAHEAAIQQAVTDGLITQAQADAMLSGTGKVRIDLRGVEVDQDALLAKALGITVEKLQAAEATAAQAELAQAVTDGRITQEQADQMTAERALQKYIADKGFFASAVQSAVKDGVITQAQADAILSQAKGGFFGGKMGHGGLDGGPGMKGGRGGARP